MLTTQEKREILDRFDLWNGQMHADYEIKDSYWFLSGSSLGFGDLDRDDIQRIARRLKDGETFEAFGAFHGSRKDGDLPTIEITPDNILYPRRIAELAKRKEN